MKTLTLKRVFAGLAMLGCLALVCVSKEAQAQTTVTIVNPSSLVCPVTKPNPEPAGASTDYLALNYDFNGSDQGISVDDPLSRITWVFAGDAKAADAVAWFGVFGPNKGGANMIGYLDGADYGKADSLCDHFKLVTVPGMTSKSGGGVFSPDVMTAPPNDPIGNYIFNPTPNTGNATAPVIPADSGIPGINEATTGAFLYQTPGANPSETIYLFYAGSSAYSEERVPASSSGTSATSVSEAFFGLSTWVPTDDPAEAGMQFGTLSHGVMLWKSATQSGHEPAKGQTIDYVTGTYDFGNPAEVANAVCGEGPNDYPDSIANQVTDANSAGLVQCTETDQNGNPAHCTANMVITLGPEGGDGETWSTCCPSTVPAGKCTNPIPCTTETCTAGKGCPWADYQTAWQNFIRQVSEYFDGSDRCHPYVMYYELWNEANGVQYWDVWQTDNGNLGCVRSDCRQPLPACSDTSGNLARRMATLAQVAYCCLSGAADPLACPSASVAQWCPARTQWGGPSRLLTPSVTGPIDGKPTPLPGCAADAWMKTYLGEAHKVTGKHGAMADLGSFHGYVVQPDLNNGMKPPWPDDRSQSSGSYTYRDADLGDVQSCMIDQAGWPGNTCYGSIQDRAGAMRKAFNVDPILKAAPMFDEGSWGSVVTLPDPNASAWLARWYVEQASLSASLNLQMAAWFAWGYYLNDPNGWGAMENPDGTRAKAADAYNLVRGWVTGAEMQPCSGPDRNDFTGCTMARPYPSEGSKRSHHSTGYVAQVVWSSAAELGHASSPYAPGSEYTQYRDLQGNPPCLRMANSCGWIMNAKNQWMIEGIDDSPVLLEGCVGNPPAGYKGWKLSPGACTPTELS